MSGSTGWLLLLLFVMNRMWEHDLRQTSPDAEWGTLLLASNGDIVMQSSADFCRQIVQFWRNYLSWCLWLSPGMRTACFGSLGYTYARKLSQWTFLCLEEMTSWGHLILWVGYNEFSCFIWYLRSMKALHDFLKNRDIFRCWFHSRNPLRSVHSTQKAKAKQMSVSFSFIIFTLFICFPFAFNFAW